jgi:hypothetical protein
MITSLIQPTLVANGSRDIMVPTINSHALAQHIPSAQIYPDAATARRANTLTCSPHMSPASLTQRSPLPENCFTDAVGVRCRARRRWPCSLG